MTLRHLTEPQHDNPKYVVDASYVLKMLETERKYIQEERRLIAGERAKWKETVAQFEKREDIRIEQTSELTKVARDLASERFSTRVRGRPIMQESFFGQVTAATSDTVSIMYDTPDGLIEHLYQRTQFIGQRLPRIGDEVQALTKLFADRPEQGSLSDILQQDDDFPFIDFTKDS